jgi:hypothetical protein
VKTTVDVPDKELEALLQFTGAATKKEAIVAAVTDFNRRRRMAELVKYSGTCDDMMTNEEIEAMDAEEFRRQFGETFTPATAAKAIPSGQPELAK